MICKAASDENKDEIIFKKFSGSDLRPRFFTTSSEGVKIPGKNARRKRNMKNGIKAVARMVKQLAENQQDLV